MIKVGNNEITIKHFPDGSQCLMNCDIKPMCNNSSYIEITWQYENDEEVITLIYLVNHIREHLFDIPIYLCMPYIPNARMDRTKDEYEVFTLKYFANIINGLKFNKVFVLDPHSDVSAALIDRCIKMSVEDIIYKVINTLCGKDKRNSDFVIYFPDAGAYKRYKDLSVFTGMSKIYGQKIRDWKTGEIKGLEIVDEDNKPLNDKCVWPLASKQVIMIDDIISYGGTLYYSALKLKEFKPDNIYAYATHVEPNSLWNEDKGKFAKLLNDETVKRLYTTNSIYNIDSSDHVIVMNVIK